MKPTLSLLTLMATLCVSCSPKISLEELARFAPTETYAEDQFLDTVAKQRALIVVAHDDDDGPMSGTIAKLTAAGWTIQQLSLVMHVDPATGKNPADLICAGSGYILEDGHYRLGLDTTQFPYLPMPYAEMGRHFLREKVADALRAQINAFGPSVIFTLDDVKGGYGHPDHVFISQLVVDLFRTQAISAQRVYQVVYTDHMEHEIVDTWLKAKMEKWDYPQPSALANEMYGIDGMPEPTVQVNIQAQAETKMRYLRAYPEAARKNLRKFIPYYEDFDAQTYFGLFNREFFRVIE